MAEELEICLPARLQVMVVEERPDLLCIVIPVDLSGIDERDSRSVTGIVPEKAAPEGR